jgi:hypothetical protein
VKFAGFFVLWYRYEFDALRIGKEISTYFNSKKNPVKKQTTNCINLINVEYNNQSEYHRKLITYRNMRHLFKIETQRIDLDESTIFCEIQIQMNLKS